MVNYWLWVNSGLMDIGEEMNKNEEYVWEGCDQRTSKGDLVLIYRTNPYKHIKYFAEVLKDPEEEEIWTQKGKKIGHTCSFIIKQSFENPLAIKQMRDSEELKDWYPLKMSFIRMVFKIDYQYWIILRDLLIDNNPNHKSVFE